MNRPGCCCLCEKPIREIISKHTSGKQKGEPKELGAWLETAWRVSYELSDGSTADISFCEDCLDGDFGNIWASVKERFLWEYDNIPAERTALQKDRVEKELNRILELSIRREIGRRLWRFV